MDVFLCRSRKTGSITGDFAYKLYDTYGLGPDTIAELAAIEMLSFDKNDFAKSLEDAKLKSKLGSSQLRKDLISQTTLDFLEKNGVPKTDDSHKYLYTYNEGSFKFSPVNAKILGFVVNGKCIRRLRRTIYAKTDVAISIFKKFLLDLYRQTSIRDASIRFR